VCEKERMVGFDLVKMVRRRTSVAGAEDDRVGRKVRLTSCFI
jgi:hypothetical protein